MTFVSNFYLSRIINNKVYSENQTPVSRLADLVVDFSFIRPKVVAAYLKQRGKTILVDFTSISIKKDRGQYILTCSDMTPAEINMDNKMSLVRHIMDRQLVDIDGKKLVRVNDLRLSILTNGIYLVAVDVGAEGRLRRLALAKPVNSVLKKFGTSLPSKLILWDEVETVDFSHAGIKLSKKYTKLSTLHPSDLADIIEDLDSRSQMELFSSLDEEKAADVLEELEPDAQVSVIEGMTVEKAADVLEKMPADEVADILDELEEEKAEALLNEMESETSGEIRELMEYPDNTVGSIMSTDYFTFNENMTIAETLAELRKLKPESDTIYYIYVVDNQEHLKAVVQLRDIVVSEPEIRLRDIMNTDIVYVYDDDKLDSINEIISKYNLLALPVVEHDNKMAGMVIINDVIYQLVKSKRKRI